MLIPWLASPDSLTAAYVPDMVFREWPPKSRTPLFLKSLLPALISRRSRSLLFLSANGFALLSDPAVLPRRVAPSQSRSAVAAFVHCWSWSQPPRSLEYLPTTLGLMPALLLSDSTSTPAPLSHRPAPDALLAQASHSIAAPALPLPDGSRHPQCRTFAAPHAPRTVPAQVATPIVDVALRSLPRPGSALALLFRAALERAPPETPPPR